MQIVINYFMFITNKIISILDTLKLPGSSSVLYYILGAIIIGFIIKLVKGGSSEFELNTNFLNSRVINTGISNYKMNNIERKAQIVNSKTNNAYNTGFKYGMISMSSSSDTFEYFDKGRKEAGL